MSDLTAARLQHSNPAHYLKDRPIDVVNSFNVL
jgi:hypothetical protein